MSKRVPKLRFKEFSGEWEEKKLIDTADKKIKWSFIGGPFGSNLKSSDYTDKGIQVIQLQNIGDSKFIDNYKIYTSEKKADELLSNNIYPNDIILSKMGDPVARACIVPDTYSRYVMCSDGIRLVIDENKFTKYFIYTYINSKKFRKLAEQASTGSTRKRIGLGDLKKLPLIIPKSPQEQQKIASTLSSLDNLIEANTKKVEALKEHKKGLMQQLFPTDDEKVPKLRFKEFSGEWEEKPLGKVAIYENGKAHEQDIRENAKYIVVNSKFISTDGTVKKYTDKAFCLAKKNDVLMVLSDVPNGRAIAKCFLADKDDLYTVNQRICRIYSKNILGRFLYYILNRSPYFLEFDDGVKQTNLKRDDVLSFPILLPKSPQEQQKIASCLSSLDNLIEANSKKIEALKEHKKGLMQQMFVSEE